MMIDFIELGDKRMQRSMTKKKIYERTLSPLSEREYSSEDEDLDHKKIISRYPFNLKN
jgi:hypothetical protein